MGTERWYGLVGLLSLLGSIGIFTGERYFLGFFAFAMDFQYFFTRADEMREGQTLRSAARGSFVNMGVTAVGTLLPLAFGGGTTGALYLSSGLGWGVEMAIYALSSFLCGCQEW